ADLCEASGADVQDVARGIGLDGRIGAKFLHAGPGYGGSCFPKDTQALVKTGQDFNAPQRLVETTVAINGARKRSIARKILTACGGTLRGKRIAVLGLTFKPNTDDMREAPSIDIIRYLQDQGAEVAAHDPEGMDAARGLMEHVSFHADPYVAAQGAAALVIVTEWDSYRALDFTRLAETMADEVLVDLRNVYRPHEVERHGFRYSGVGRGDAGVLA
ncbi:MAG: UDP binding domain-containing protein, partial [Hyphomicrobiales bacterium]